MPVALVTRGHDNVATKQDLQVLEAKLELVKHQLITGLGGLMVVLAGLLFAALHYWLVAARLIQPHVPFRM